MNHVTQLLGLAVQVNQPVLLWSPPGEGKTSTVRAVATALGAHMETTPAGSIDPTVVAGVYVPSADRSHVAAVPLDWAIRLRQASDQNQRAIWFCDELSTAPPAVQAACLRPILEGWVGNLYLGDRTSRVAAANPSEWASGGYDLRPATANRFLHLQFELSYDEWATGSMAGWPTPRIPVLPDEWRMFIPQAKAEVFGFLRARPQHLRPAPTTKPHELGRAYPSKRSWEHILVRMRAAILAAVGNDVELTTLAAVGAVGEGPGMEYGAWVGDDPLPDPKDVLRDPRFEIPRATDRAFAILMGAVAWGSGEIQNALDAANPSGAQEVYEQLLALIEKYLHAGHKDLAAVAVRHWFTHPASQRMEFPTRLLQHLYEFLVATGILPNVAAPQPQTKQSRRKEEKS